MVGALRVSLGHDDGKGKSAFEASEMNKKGRTGAGGKQQHKIVVGTSK